MPQAGQSSPGHAVPPLKGTYRGTAERLLRVDVPITLLDANETVAPEPGSGTDPAA